MSKYALIDTRSNVVANVIVWDGVTPYTPPTYHVTRQVRAGEIVGPSWGYDPMADVFVEPPPEPEPAPEEPPVE